MGEQRREYVRENLKTDFFPTMRHLTELQMSTSRLETTTKRATEKSEALRNTTLTYDENAASLGEKIEKNGGADVVLSAVREQKQQMKKQTVMAAVLSSVGVLASSASVVFVLMQQLFGLAFLAERNKLSHSSVAIYYLVTPDVIFFFRYLCTFGVGAGTPMRVFIKYKVVLKAMLVFCAGRQADNSNKTHCGSYYGNCFFDLFFHKPYSF
jgi:hypothetical protein